MKDHKKDTRAMSIYDFEGPVDRVIERIREYAEGLIDPEINVDHWYEEVNLTISGWVPMTEKEKEAAKRKALAAKEAAKRRKERLASKDRQQLEKLAKKLGVTVIDVADG